MDSATLWGLVASIVSVVLGVLAFVVSLYFFVQAKDAEKQVSGSLTKIETQADVLQRLTSRQLDRLTKFVTEPPPRPPDPHLERLIAVLVQVAQPLSSGLAQAPTRQNSTEQFAELVSCYIIIRQYAALANFWAQAHLPKSADFDPANETHAIVRRVLDSSANDVVFMDDLLSKIDESWLRASPYHHVFVETNNVWRSVVKASADVFVAQSKA